MTEYKQGKIYKIICKETNRIYYGSTIKSLNHRLSQHKAPSSTRCLTRDFINPVISLVENYPCNNKVELLTREGWWIKNNVCVNKQIAGRTVNEWAEDTGEYKKRYWKDVEKSRQQSRDDYYNNHEQRLEKANSKVSCPLCDKLISYGNLPRHKKTQHN